MIKSGVYSSLQDYGRAGHADQGIPQGGVLDRQSYELVNMLVGNDEKEPVIEATLLGPTIRFTQSLTIAITGSNLSPMINKVPIELNSATYVTKGDVLSFGRLMGGCRCYIGISGSWQVPKWLDSCSPLSYGNVLTNNILKKGSIIKIAKCERSVRPSLMLPNIDHHRIHQLKMLPGPEYDWFNQDQIKQLTQAAFTISNNSNRMGYRLDGYHVKMTQQQTMISSGILPGTVQITKDGTPIILLQDAQTIGGYPRIGILEPNSLNQMAHIKPGDRVRMLFS